MTSSTPLTLFPALHRTAVPRKSSLKKSTPNASPVTPGELRGVALQITTPSSSGTSPVVAPATDHIKHSLFCDTESSTPGHYIQGRPKKHVRSRRRSSASQTVTSRSNSPAQVNESLDDITPLPENTSFGPPPTSPRRHPAAQLKRPTVPAHISVEVLPDEEMMASPNGDKPSPLPTQQSFSSRPFAQPEYPSAISERSGSPTLVRSNSGSSVRSGRPPPKYTTQARSIFPQYDHTRAFQEQQYYPTVRSPTPTLSSEKVSKFDSPNMKRPHSDRFDSAVALVDGYEHIPIGTLHDQQEVWKASSNIFPCGGRKLQLGLHQPHGQGTSLAVGVSQDQLLYSMKKEFTSEAHDAPQILAVSKHHPFNASADTIAQMCLPDPSRNNKQREDDVVAVFPQLAAVNAIEAISNSPAAAEIATFDPTASGPEAKRLAQDAVAEAHARHRCELVRSTRKRDSLGAVTASYRLEHPYLGSFAITVTKSTAGNRHSKDPRAKISLHHPSATPAAVAAENLVLAFLDFARNSCILDTPGLLALEGPYVIDTVLCALLAVAVIENDALVAETLTFDAPPTSPLPIAKNKAGGELASNDSGDSKRRWWGAKKAKKVKKQDQVDLPLATEAALGLLGLGFKTAVFVLEVGVKVTAGAVIGATHLARKL